MKVLGIDPGVARAGWAIISKDRGVVAMRGYGCITTGKNELPETRLLQVYQSILALIAQYQPDVMAVEDLFFTTNAKTVIGVAQARGIMLLAAAQKGLSVASYSPLAVKLAVAGYGKATKEQVQKMVVRTLKLAKVPQPDDAADAVAVGLTHCFCERMKQ